MNQEITNYPDKVFKFFNQEVNKLYKNHPKTKGWIQEVISEDSFYHREQILKRGQADFNNGFNKLTPEEKVTLYCNYYLQMHVASGYYVLKKGESVLRKFFAIPNKNICFIDFGCGPLTSGISLAWACLDWSEIYGNNRLKINYLGIDTAIPMIKKAKNISSKYSNLFDNSIYSFDFIKDFAKYSKISNFIENKLVSCEDELIVLNFSYFFASDSLDVEEIIDLVEKIINNYGIQHQIVILFQNPINGYKNGEWQNFRERIQLNVVVEDEEEIKYRNTTSAYNEKDQSEIKTIQLKYAVLTDRHE